MILETRLNAGIYKLIRYLISGGTAALVNWATFFLLVHITKIYYLYASILAFIVSIGISFMMQKFWTFRDKLTQDIHMQFARYIGVIVFSLILNTFLVYILVEKISVWYLLAQIIATAIIAVINFFAYRHLVFHKHAMRSVTN